MGESSFGQRISSPLKPVSIFRVQPQSPPDVIYVRSHHREGHTLLSTVYAGGAKAHTALRLNLTSALAAQGGPQTSEPWKSVRLLTAVQGSAVRPAVWLGFFPWSPCGPSATSVSHPRYCGCSC